MTRVKRGSFRRRRCKKIYASNRGFRRSSHRLFSIANQKNLKAKFYAFQHRHQKKTIMRQMWIMRINSIARFYGFHYSQLMSAFKQSNILLNRKIIAQLLIFDPGSFDQYLKTNLNRFL